MTLVAGFLLLGANDAKAQAAACVAGETLQTYTFPAGFWTAGALSHAPVTVGAGATAVNLTFSIAGSAAFTGGSPTQATIGNTANTLLAQHATAGTGILLSTQTLAFSRPVNKLRFVSMDVDSAGFQDVLVTAVNGATVPTSMVSTGGAGNHTINLATGTATAVYNVSCANTSTACNVTSGFNLSNITTAKQEFRTGPSHDGTTQYIGWNTFSWCLPALANITLRKTWVNATLNDSVTVAAAGATPTLTSLASIANTANETDASAVQTVTVGSVLNLSETFTTGSAANYTTTLACTGTSGLAGSTLTVGAADTNIVCTYTNTRKPTLTVTKTASASPLVVGQTGQSYTITIAVANGPTTAPITLADTLPTGFTTSGAVTATGGSLSGCPASGATNLTGCSIAAGAVNGNIVITVPVNVVSSAANPSTNNATATGGGDPLCTGIAPACTGSVTLPVTRVASITIAKTDGKSVSFSGGTNNYIVSINNQGPSPADGSVVTDVVGTGLTCPAANAVVCTVTAGAAVCPAGPLTIANLTGAGVTLATFPANSTLQFAYTCNVN